jgi:LysM repeat protein
MDPPEGDGFYERDYSKKSRHDKRHRGGSSTVVAYKVRPGDSIQKMAKKMGMSVAELKASNPKVNWSKLKNGQRLKLVASAVDNDKGSRRAKVGGKNRPTKGKQIAMKERDEGVSERDLSSSKKRSSSHKVRKGDTISDIAKRYKVSAKSLKQLNGIAKNKKLKAGKTLRIPTPQQASAATPAIRY